MSLGLATASGAWLPGVEVLAKPGIFLSLAVVIIAGVGLAAAVRRQSVSFLLTLLTISAAFALYVVAGEGAHENHGIRGAVVCLALTWELWTSGAAMTNRDIAAFPRRARILFFIGYLLVVATCVFFFVERDFAYLNTTVGAWDSEGWIAFGIVNMGLAFVFMRHVQILAGAVRGRAAHA